MFREIWGAATSTQPVPDTALVVALGVVALVVVGSPVGYRLVRHLVTVVHEAGHALVAVLSGRRLTGIRLHADTSGVTVSRGRPRGPGMVATLLAGYPAPAVFALGSAWLLTRGYAVGLLWLIVASCALMLVLIRNLYGLWVVLVLGGGVGALSWLLPPGVLGWIGYLIVWGLLLAAPRSVVELARQRRGGRARTSDADQLAELTGVPGVLWVGLFAVLTTGAAAAGAWLLLTAG
ncbi:M50 family metallopeptidase [Ornithinicoccus hortensis]|uniref:Peptidase M50B-like protein n=1 Tax=Ornithinicoccus hortensis TaxID=82346 RepID=A0A542YME1_9MICO|nr:M50 family metallopeptidase [Ornithinicoccus hortensis]TQL49211.1 peptidase M50B-like protein [Ornithinicoccus hortensis]